jgi:hypothetical protein
MRLLALAALLLGGCAVAPVESKLPASASVEVVKATFGLFNRQGTDKPSFVPSNVVPLVVDQSYGWVMLIKTDASTVRWREEFTLPAAPATWGGPERIGTRAMSDDGRTMITEREVAPRHGLIFNLWSVAAGDPAGAYRMRVSIDGHWVHTFEFQVR